MNTEHLVALRQAATALISTAAAPTVLAALRALIDGTEAAPRSPSEPKLTPTSRPKAAPRPQPSPRVTSQPDGEWDARRREIRAAMLDRGVGYQDLADQFGVAVRTLRHALGRREPPTRAMRQRLETWLENEPAPAVGAETPFRANGAGRLHDAAARTSPG
jgi:hypothetical protein